MFEPKFEEEEPVTILLFSAINEWKALPQSVAILEDLSEQVFDIERPDLLLVYGASISEAEQIQRWCDQFFCSVAFIEESTGFDVAMNVMINIKGKLDGHEMPNNIDVADVRYLTERSNSLMGFDCSEKLAEFLSETAQESIKDVLFLLHGQVTEDSIRQANDMLASRLNENASIYLSVFSEGKTDCTALVGLSN